MSVHVIGAGLAGLAAACQLTELGHHVVLFEAAPQAGGRARSYFDKQLGCRIDNGNHLLLSGNISTLSYLHRIGARRSLIGPAEPIFPFRDVVSGQDWTLRLNKGAFPWWVFSRARRVPGTRLLQYRALKRLRTATRPDSVSALVGTAGQLYHRLLKPLAISALNTMPEDASAEPLRAVLAETIERGGYATLPRWARLGLSETFIDPALEWLRTRGADVRMGERVTELQPGQATVVAVPPWVAAELVPGLHVPTEFESICNLHFRAQMDPGEAGFWGLVGGMSEWVFVRKDVISVTISAANRYADMDHEAIAARVWGELARTFKLDSAVPPNRVLWEKRATIRGTPAQLALRPGTRTAIANVMLAGDWTDTGLPATIEGAIRSGNAAAMALVNPA
ncbi:hydroxysqualene dehydroxylase HpnE [Acidocella sp. KAb 2-4]|uniref:hydroxysqualene dehydroxylase HpnE n=1 Tax=Acidocella sp. KAb 2-4 TaxID=2885158 RepID=UPI001D0892F5|nr:hydroxysqualene dehydroxylase HpnE [Acidocella sp. KAb 2-4]MCB5945448.1 hydroxysqualene dehydroxylase HpnE [Acidocella sp. KAb 2-4]